MECLELPIGCEDRLEFLQHLIHLAARHREVQFVVPKPGIHAVADAADARHTGRGS